MAPLQLLGGFAKFFFFSITALISECKETNRSVLRNQRRYFKIGQLRFREQKMLRNYSQLAACSLSSINLSTPLKVLRALSTSSSEVQNKPETNQKIKHDMSVLP